MSSASRCTGRGGWLLAYLRRDGQLVAVDQTAAVISATLARLRRAYG